MLYIEGVETLINKKIPSPQIVVARVISIKGEI